MIKIPTCGGTCFIYHKKNSVYSCISDTPLLYSWIIYTLKMGPKNRPKTFVNNQKKGHLKTQISQPNKFYCHSSLVQPYSTNLRRYRGLHFHVVTHTETHSV